MPLAEGDAADPGEVWLRVVKEPKWIKEDGSVPNNAFTGAAFRSLLESPWSIELSGALLSLVPDLEVYGKGKCGEGYAGHMYQVVEKLYCIEHAIDVIFTPKPNAEPPDLAHADAVSFRVVIEDKHLMRDWLQEVISTVRRNQFGPLEALRKAS
jgi:hypothetical protein